MKRLGLIRAELASTGLIFATATGPLSTVEAFQRGMIQDAAGNSRLFPNTVMNAAPGHVALLLGLRGPTATYCSGTTGGGSALHLGRRLVASGACDRVVVLAAEEVTGTNLSGYARFDGYLSRDHVRPFGGSGCVFTGAAVAVLLEAADIDTDRPDLGRLTGFGFAGDDSGPGGLSRDPAALRRAMRGAAAAAGRDLADVQAVVSNACGRKRPDRLEWDAITAEGLAGRPVSAAGCVRADASVRAAAWGRAGDMDGQ